MEVLSVEASVEVITVSRNIPMGLLVRENLLHVLMKEITLYLFHLVFIILRFDIFLHFMIKSFHVSIQYREKSKQKNKWTVFGFVQPENDYANITLYVDVFIYISLDE